MSRWRPGGSVARMNRAAATVEFPPAIWKTCPWEPRPLIEQGLRQWLRCAGAALRDDQVIGMPSHAVDEAWHGFILCTVEYARFCKRAYGAFLHHHPEGGAPQVVQGRSGTTIEQLRRTVVAWTLVAEPDERCVLWNLDAAVGVSDPWGLAPRHVAEVLTALGAGTGAVVSNRTSP